VPPSLTLQQQRLRRPILLGGSYLPKHSLATLAGGRMGGAARACVVNLGPVWLPGLGHFNSRAIRHGQPLKRRPATMPGHQAEFTKDRG